MQNNALTDSRLEEIALIAARTARNNPDNLEAILQLYKDDLETILFPDLIALHERVFYLISNPPTEH